MRAPRNRRNSRYNRKHSKQVYIESSIKIQRCFRNFLETRYSKLCPKNYKEDECILFEPVRLIPRDVLVVVDEVGFDCRSFLTWMTKSSTHPLTRERVPDSFKIRCISSAVVFLERENRRNSNRKGFFSRKRILRRTLQKHGQK